MSRKLFGGIRDNKDTYLKLLNVVALMIIVISILFTFAGFMYSYQQEKKYEKKNRMTNLKVEGTYRVNNKNEEKNIPKDSKFKLKGYNTVIVTGHLNHDVPAGTQVMMRIDNMKVKFFVNDTLVYSLGEKGDYVNYAKSPGNMWAGFVSSGIVTQDNIRIELSNLYVNHVSNVYEEFFNNLSMGQETTVVLESIKQNRFNTFLAYFMITIGIITFVFAILTKDFKIKTNRLFIFTAASVSSGFWCKIDFRVQNYLSPYPVTNNGLDIVLVILALSFLLLFITYNQERFVKRITQSIILITFIGLIVMAIFQYTGYRDYYEYFFVIDGLIIYGLLISIYITIHGVVRCKNCRTLLELLAPNLIWLGGMLDVIGIYTGLVSYTFFSKIGYVLFTVLQFFLLGDNVRELYTENMRTNFYRELAYKDVMTGIENRIAFNEYAVEIQNRIFVNDRVGIVIIDINNLKKTNEESGYRSGDAVIVKTSELIKSVFVHSRVFRIGGDEFAIVLEDECLKDYNSMLELLQNKLIENAINCAVGFAIWNKAENRSFEELFLAADNAMYEKKMRMNMHKRSFI